MQRPPTIDLEEPEVQRKARVQRRVRLVLARHQTRSTSLLRTSRPKVKLRLKRHKCFLRNSWNSRLNSLWSSSELADSEKNQYQPNMLSLGLRHQSSAGERLSSWTLMKHSSTANSPHSICKPAEHEDTATFK